MRLTLLLGLLAFVAACHTDPASDGGWGGTIDTLPGGIPVVKNPERGLWQPGEEWKVVEEVRIGTDSGEGPASFSQIGALEVDQTGRLYVLDSEGQDIRVFDSTGAWVRTIGRKGGGPGEFEQAMGMSWDSAGRLWVVDQANGRFSLFDTSGTYLTSYPRLTNGMFTYYWAGGFTPHDGLVDVAYSQAMSRQALVRLDAQAHTTADTFTVPAYEPLLYKFANKGMQITTTVPFTPTLTWSLGPGGDLWFGVSEDYRIVRRRLRGDTVRIIEKDWTPKPVTDAERDSALAHYGWFTKQGGRVDASKVPSSKPAFDRFTLDDQGNLWVVPGGTPPGTFDVFDGIGRYLGQVATGLEVSGPLALIRHHHFYAPVADSLGVPYLVIARIQQ